MTTNAIGFASFNARSNGLQSAVLILAFVTAAGCGSGAGTDPTVAQNSHADLETQTSSDAAPSGSVDPDGALPTPSQKAASLGYTVVVRASGTPSAGTYPRMTVAVNGQMARPGPVYVGPALQEYAFTTAQPIPAGALVTVRYDNDESVVDYYGRVLQDRNLYVDSIDIAGRVISATDASVQLDRGLSSMWPGQRDLWWNATLRFTAPGGPEPAVPSATVRERLNVMQAGYSVMSMKPLHEWVLRPFNGTINGSLKSNYQVCPYGGSFEVVSNGVRLWDGQSPPSWTSYTAYRYWGNDWNTSTATINITYRQCSDGRYRLDGGITVPSTLLEHRATGYGSYQETTSFQVQAWLNQFSMRNWTTTAWTGNFDYRRRYSTGDWYGSSTSDERTVSYNAWRGQRHDTGGAYTISGSVTASEYSNNSYYATRTLSADNLSLFSNARQQYYIQGTLQETAYAYADPSVSVWSSVGVRDAGSVFGAFDHAPLPFASANGIYALQSIPWTGSLPMVYRINQTQYQPTETGFIVY